MAPMVTDKTSRPSSGRLPKSMFSLVKKGNHEFFGMANGNSRLFAGKKRSAREWREWT